MQPQEPPPRPYPSLSFLLSCKPHLFDERGAASNLSASRSMLYSYALEGSRAAIVSLSQTNHDGVLMNYWKTLSTFLLSAGAPKDKSTRCEEPLADAVFAYAMKLRNELLERSKDVKSAAALAESEPYAQYVLALRFSASRGHPEALYQVSQMLTLDSMEGRACIARASGTGHATAALEWLHYQLKPHRMLRHQYNSTIWAQSRDVLGMTNEQIETHLQQLEQRITVPWKRCAAMTVPLTELKWANNRIEALQRVSEYAAAVSSPRSQVPASAARSQVTTSPLALADSCHKPIYANEAADYTTNSGTQAQEQQLTFYANVDVKQGPALVYANDPGNIPKRQPSISSPRNSPTTRKPSIPPMPASSPSPSPSSLGLWSTEIIERSIGTYEMSPSVCRQLVSSVKVPSGEEAYRLTLTKAPLPSTYTAPLSLSLNYKCDAPDWMQLVLSANAMRSPTVALANHTNRCTRCPRNMICVMRKRQPSEFAEPDKEEAACNADALCYYCVVQYLTEIPIFMGAVISHLLMRAYPPLLNTNKDPWYEATIAHLAWPFATLLLPYDQVDSISTGDYFTIRYQEYESFISYFLNNGNLAKSVTELLCTPCFYGRLSSEKAAELLKNKSGYFLVRFSSQPGSYAISRCKRDGQVVHVRIEIVSSREGKLDEMRVCVGSKEDEMELGKRRFKSLKEVLTESRRVLRLKHPLCASPYYAHMQRGYRWETEDFRQQFGDLVLWV